MSSRSKSNRQKNVNPHGKQLHSLKKQINKETYFQTGRINKLDRIHYYIGHTYSKQEEMIIFVTVTRMHTNGHLAFAIFGIHDESGWIEKVQFDFNVDSQSFMEFVTGTTNMEPFEDSDALEHLIFSAEIKSREMGKLPADYWLAEKILQTDKTSLLEERHPRLVATFQSPEGLSSKTKDLYLEAIKQVSREGTYEPASVSSWGQNDWETFVRNNQPFKERTDEHLLDSDYLTPMVYLFRHTVLPELEAKRTTTTKTNQAITQFLDTLSRQISPQPKVLQSTGSEPLFIHEGSEEENFLSTSLQADLNRENSIPDHLITIRRIKKAITKYPENPVFRNILYTAYKSKGELQAAAKAATDNYRKLPDHPHFFITYLAEMVRHGKTGRLRSFFKKGYLLEDHLDMDMDKDNELSAEIFFQYYQLVGAFLGMTGKHLAFWQLYELLQSHPDFEKAGQQNGWQTMFVFSAYAMTEILQSASNQQIDARIGQALLLSAR